MKKGIRITPVGLKGNEINERMKVLMGIGVINESKGNTVIELTKRGPDGKVYAIVRENHQHYIKVTDKKDNLIAEDFKYIGGLMNKASEAYPSYAKAIKHLNLKFKSLAEAYGTGSDINVFENDNLVNENGVAGGFMDMPKGGGFTGEGNLHGNKPLAIDEEKVEENEMCDEEKLTEVEQAVEDMTKEKEVKKEKKVNETHKLSILRALENMDAIIDTLAEGKVKKKVYTIK
jgi:hypothetical protein